MNRPNRRSNEQAAVLLETNWTRITQRSPVNSVRKCLDSMSLSKAATDNI